MTLLSVVQDAMSELGLTAPTSVIGNNNALVVQMLAHFTDIGQSLRQDYLWPQLEKEYTFLTVDSQADYALPADFDRFAFDTHWDRDNNWQLIGPLSPQEWQWYKSGTLQQGPRNRYRIKGITDLQLFIDPTPDSVAAGHTLVFEYYTTNWVRPVTWASGDTFLTGAYCAYNGNYYALSGSGGNAGSTPPTHTSGTVSDGGLSWTYYDGIYERPTADTDVCNIPERVVKYGMKYLFQHAKNLNFEGYQQMFLEEARKQSSARRGASVVNMLRQRNNWFISNQNIPDTFPI